MGAVLTDDSPARFGAPFGTYAIEPSLRRMVCRGTIRPLAATRIRPSGPEWSRPWPGHLGHSGVAICCVSL